MTAAEFAAKREAKRKANLIMGYKGPHARMPVDVAPGLVGADAWAAAAKLRRKVLETVMEWKHSVRAQS